MWNVLYCDLPCKNYDFGQKIADMQKFANFCENLMANCAVPIAPNIPQL